jgi:uncharacterized OB-fold protein
MNAAVTTDVPSQSNSERARIVGGIGADEEFWNFLENGELRLPRCTGCGRWTWPAHWRCGECGSWDFEWVRREPVGRIFSWTRTWYAFDRTRERADDIPYVVALVEVADSGGARVMGIFDGADEDVRIGQAVTGLIAAPSPKTKHYPSIVWKPAASGFLHQSESAAS